MEKVSEMISKEYKEQMKKLLAENYENYVSALDESAVRGLRVNTKKISVDEFLRNNSF